MAEFNNSINIDAGQAINTLDRLDKALGSATIAMGTFQAVADKSIPGSGFAEVAKTAEDFGKKGPAALKKVDAAAKRTRENVKSIGLSFRDVGRIVESQIIFAGLSALRQGFFEAAEAAEEFQLQIARIAAVDQDLNFDEAREKVEALASTIGRDLGEVSEAVFEALQNDLEEFGDTFELLGGQANDLALVTGGTLPQAVNALSSVLKTYGDDLGTTNTIAEQFFGTINAGRITLADLESSLGTLAPLGTQIGVTLKELTDSLATISLTGTKANVATTQLRNVFNKLIKPTKELQAVYEQLGVRGFRELSERSGGFVKALEVLQEQVKGQEDGLSRLFNTIRANVGVLNILTDDTKLYEDTARRSAEAAKSLSREIENINKTDARQAQINAAKLEVIYTKLGDETLKAKIAVGEFFLTFISQSEEAIKVQTSLAGAVVASTLAVTKLGIAVKAAVPPIAAFTAVVLLGTKATDGVKELAGAYFDLVRESANLDAEAAKKFVEAIREMDAEEIEEAVDAFEDADTVLNRVAEAATKAGNEIKKAFDVEAGNIRAVEANLLEAFGDARSRVLSQIEDAIDDIDDKIIDGTKRIGDITADLDEFRFEVSIEGLTDGAKAAERIQRASDKVAAAFLETSKVGLDELSVESARNAAKNAESEARSALSAAKRAKSQDQIAKAQRLVETSMKARLQLEDKLIKLQKSESIANLKEQEALFEKISGDALVQVKEFVAARQKVAEAIAEGASPAEVSKLREALVTESNEAREALIKTGQQEILKKFGLKKPIDDAIRTLATGLKNTEIDWTKAINNLKKQLAERTDLQAAVKLTTEILDTEGIDAGVLKRLEEANVGLPGEALKSVAKEAQTIFEENKKLQDEINRSTQEQKAAAAQAKSDFADATLGVANLNTGAVEATKLTKPILDQLKNLSKLNKTELEGLLKNLEAAIPAIAEQSTGLFGTFSEAQKQALLDGTEAAIVAVKERLQNIERIRLFDSNELRSAQELLDRFSATKVEELKFEIDDEGIDAINETLDTTVKKGKDAVKATAAIGEAGRQSVQGINALDIVTGGLVSTANAAKSAYQALLDTAREALRIAQEAASLNSQNLAFGGQPVSYRAAGGDARGQDTMPAMLNPEEFVMNARTSRNFLPELQAINAGNAPGASGNAGDTNITIGDINVSSSSDVPGQTARDIALSIKRELRRGTSRL